MCKPGGINAFGMFQKVFLDGMSEVAVSRMHSTFSPQAGNYALKKLKKLAKHAPENALNKVYLIEAERLVLQGNEEKALTRFQKSIEYANEQGLFHEQALALERCGMALIRLGSRERAIESFEGARKLYKRWGAFAKVDQITKLVREL